MSEELLLVPVNETIVFPAMTVSLPRAEVAVGERVLLVPRDADGAYASVGTIAEVTELARLPRGGHVAVLAGSSRGLPGVARTGPDGRLYVPVTAHPDENPPRAATATSEREYRAIVEEIVELRGIDGRVSAFVRAIGEAGALADTAGYSPDLTHEQKVRILEVLDVQERLAIAIELQRDVLLELQVRRRIRDDIQDETQKQQRDFFLRKQMDSIRRELGEDEASVIDEYRSQLERVTSQDGGMPEAVREQFERELGRLDRMGEGGMEAQTIRSYLDWLLAVPWGESTDDELNVVRAREVLDAEHAGLEDVKDRIDVIGGDFFADELPPADIYALGRIIHDWSEPKIRVLLAKILAALPSGGAVFLAEKVLDDTKTGPEWAVLQHLNMLTVAEGRERTEGEYADLLTTAGFADVRCLRTDSLLDVVMGTKK